MNAVIQRLREVTTEDEGAQKPAALPTFHALSAAMRSPRQLVRATFLSEPDTHGVVTVSVEGKVHQMVLSGIMLQEARKWFYRKQALKGAEITVRYRSGNPRPEVEFRAADGGLL